MSRWLPGTIAVLVLSILTLASPPPVLGASLTVNSFSDNLTDDNQCTLREALKVARTNSVAVVNDCGATPGSSVALDTVNVPKHMSSIYAIETSAFGLDTGDLNTGDATAGPLLIQGTGPKFSATIDANDLNRVLEVGANGVVTLSQLTLTDGSTTATVGGGIIRAGTASSLTLNSVVVSNGTASVIGGGISSDGDLQIDGATISGNTANNITGGGAGIHSTGTFDITNARITGNTATPGTGAGIRTFEAGTFTLRNSLLSGNTAGSGSAWSVGADVATTSAILTNVTISTNLSSVTEGVLAVSAGDTLSLSAVTISGNAGRALKTFGAATFQNTIINDSTCSVGGAGTITSLGHNIDSGSTCFSAVPGPGDLTNTNPLLGPLQNNSGATETHALLPGSPAIDAGDAADCEALDQRGQTRPKDGDSNGSEICDIGAYEAAAGTTTPSPTASSTASPSPTASPTATATATATTTNTNTAGPTGSGEPTATEEPTETGTGAPSQTATATPTATATLSPTPTSEGPTPSPAPTNEPGLLHGDILCNGGLDPDDVLALLSFLALLREALSEGCDFPLGEEIAPQLFWGDVSCDFAITVLDALIILLASQTLGFPIPTDCLEPGQPVPG